MDSDPLLITALVIKISAVGVLLGSCEWLTFRHALREDGLISWSVGSVRNVITASPLLERLLNVIFGYPNVLVLHGLRIVAAVTMLAMPVNRVTSLPFLLLFTILVCATWVRHPYGNDGAEQMTVITLVALVIGRLPGTSIALTAALWFVALQLCLSYSTAGFTKMTASKWWNGTYLRGVFGTRIYGHHGVAVFLNSAPRLAMALSVCVLVWEAAFPLVLVLPANVSYAVVISGVVFHIANAVFMGLNNFVWSFLGAYPALIYVITTRPSLLNF